MLTMFQLEHSIANLRKIFILKSNEHKRNAFYSVISSKYHIMKDFIAYQII